MRNELAKEKISAPDFQSQIWKGGLEYETIA